MMWGGISDIDENNNMQFGDGARRCVIPTNVMDGTVVVTQGEPVWAQGVVAGGLDLAGGTYVGT